jgi:type VI secretion system protein ImpJ
MTARAVHWNEGMFLRPHHLQAAQRYTSEQLHRSSQFDQHYNWGLRAIDLDPEALANHRLVVRSLQIRLRDGTIVSVPEDGELPEINLKPVLASDSTTTIFLAVPVVHLGRANLAGERPVEGGRYLVDALNLEDENTGLNPQPIEVRRLNLQLLLSTQDHAGFEVLPIACFEKSAGADTTPKLHLPYIPPVVGCDAWAPLRTDVLQAIYDRIGRKIELLSDMVLSRGISLETQSQGDALIVNHLRVLNEAYALLNILAFAQGVHPLAAYAELCRLVGQLAFFGETRRAPDLPRYDHDDLGRCFYAVKKHIDSLLYGITEPDYKARPFEGAGKRMQVTLEPAWLESVWQMYVGVKSPLKAEECISLLTKGQLDMKIGSSEKVDRIFQMGAMGLKFTHTPTPPRALPHVAGLIYFQVSRDSEEWENVRKSLTLAIRLNELKIAGNIQGQRVLTIQRADGQPTTMEFTLYVVKGT